MEGFFMTSISQITVIIFYIWKLIITPVLNRAMKKMKYLLIMILVTMVSGSCVEDEFGNVVGTWIYPTFQDASNKIPPESESCESQVTITFHNNLTGILDMDKYCNPDSEKYDFIYNVKEGTLTITYNEGSTHSRYDGSESYSYVVSNNELTLIDKDGIITVLARE